MIAKSFMIYIFLFGLSTVRENSEIKKILKSNQTSKISKIGSPGSNWSRKISVPNRPNFSKMIQYEDSSLMRQFGFGNGDSRE